MPPPPSHSLPTGDPAAVEPPLWADWLLRHRGKLLILWLLVHAAAFNGLWRFGIDSSKYRHVARSLADGEGYAILGEPQRHVYPGLPYLLAGLESVFGPVAWPGILVMLLCSVATLAVSYALLRRMWPAWAATAATAGVAFNYQFVKHGHELLTDAPFLLAVVLSLWGWEALADRGAGKRSLAGAALLGGLALAAAMRPTFWPLALALGLACVAGLCVGLIPALRRREFDKPDAPRPWPFYAGCLAVVVSVGLAFLLLDPRTQRFDPLAGEYEAEVAGRLRDVAGLLAQTPDKFAEAFGDELPTAFFAEQMKPLSVLFALALLSGVALTSRRRPTWSLLVAGLLATLYLASTQPRYYLMVMPILWAGWLTLSTWSAGRFFRTPKSRSIYTGIMVGLVIALNLGHCVKLIIEQRGRPFVEHYERGIYAPLVATAEVIARETKPGEVVVGPFAPTLTYLSDRKVIGNKEMRLEQRADPRAQAEAIRDGGATWMVFPHPVYRRKDGPIYQLGRVGVVVPTNASDEEAYPIGRFGREDWYLARFGVDLDMLPPPGVEISEAGE